MFPFKLRTMFGLACMCTLGAGALLLLEPRGSAQFYITVWTLLIAIAFLATVVLVIRGAVHREDDERGDV